MDKVRLKKCIKNLAVDTAFVAIAVVFTLLAVIGAIVGRSSWGFAILETFFVITEFLYVSQDWKKIKAMLDNPEKTDESAN